MVTTFTKIVRKFSSLEQTLKFVVFDFFLFDPDCKNFDCKTNSTYSIYKHCLVFLKRCKGNYLCK